MKLASLRNGRRDGALHVVDRDLARALPCQAFPSLQAALDNWAEAAPILQRLADELAEGRQEGTLPFRFVVTDVDSTNVTATLTLTYWF